MKKILLALFVVACGTTLSAQTTKTTSKAGTSKSSTSLAKTDAKADKQVKDALLKDPQLQAEAIKYLSGDKEFMSSMATMTAESKGSQMDLVKSILGDKKMCAAAVKYIQDNPELMQRAMRAVGVKKN